MGAHSKIGASSMKRWRNCPGSVKLCENVPKKSSVYADDGTRAHKLAEDIIRARIDGTMGPDTFDFEPETVEAVNVYVDHVLSLRKPGCIQVLEHKFNLDNLYKGCFGTADCVTYYPDTKQIVVTDYKNGAGVFVDAERNDQLLYYALGAIITMNVPVIKVRIEIVQPRLGVGAPIRHWDTDIFFMWEFADELVEAAARTDEPNAALAAGDWCRFCPAAPICPLLKEQSLALAQKTFSKVEPFDMDDLVEGLRMAPMIAARIKAMHELAYSLAVAGTKIPGHKIVEKNATRKWKAADNVVADQISAALHGVNVALQPNDFFKAVFLSPPQIEQVLNNTSLLPMNKRQVKEFVSSFTESKSSGYSLVADSDKRPEAAKIDPNTVFSVVDEE